MMEASPKTPSVELQKFLRKVKAKETLRKQKMAEFLGNVRKETPQVVQADKNGGSAPPKPLMASPSQSTALREVEAGNSAGPTHGFKCYKRNCFDCREERMKKQREEEKSRKRKRVEEEQKRKEKKLYCCLNKKFKAREAEMEDRLETLLEEKLEKFREEITAQVRKELHGTKPSSIHPMTAGSKAIVKADSKKVESPKWTASSCIMQ